MSFSLFIGNILSVLISTVSSISYLTPESTSVRTPTNNPPLTVYFKKPAAWPNAKIYYWGETPVGTMPDVAWSGVNMNLMQAGCDWYYFTFPAAVDCSNIIFNSGTGSQTPDLNRCNIGYYEIGVGWTATPPAGYCGNPPPSVSVDPAGPYNSPSAFVITLNIYDNSDPNPTIHYTLDGSTPTTSSPSGLNGMTLNISQNTTLKVIGVDASGAVSAVVTHNYTVGSQPSLTVYFYKPVGWSTAKIHYWNPSPAGSATPTTWPGVNMTQNQAGCDWYYYTFPNAVDCINMIFNNGGSGSGNQTPDLINICDDAYYIVGTGWSSTPPTGFCSANAAPTLTVLPLGGECTLPSVLSITASDSDGDPVIIRYTLNGTDPGPTSTIWVPGTTPPIVDFTLKVRAYDDELASSPIVTRTYTDNNNAPTHSISPVGPLTFNPSTNVVITANDDCTSSATIYYTTNGSNPTTSSSNAVNSKSFFLTQTTTIKYFVSDNNGNSSAIQSHTYTHDPNFGCGSTDDDYFSWDNATVYFTVTDRFNNGTTTNDVNYGRQSDVVGGFHGGDLQGLTQKITQGYFDSLGVDAIWFTPPIEQIHGNVPGWGMVPEFQRHYGYHGYYALDWTEIDANMGTMTDFRTMIDSAHAHGIRVVMDVVLNHTGYDTPQDMTEFGWSNCSNWWGPQWVRKDDIAGCTPCGGGDLQSCLAGLPDVITESTTNVSLPPVLLTKWNATKEAQEIAELNTFFNNTGLPRTPVNHIVKWLTDWVREFGVDAFRLDTYKHVELQHWGTLKTQADIALAEWKAANPTKKLDDKPFWMVGENYGSGITRWADAINIGKTDALINFNFQGQAGNMATIDNIYTSYASVANPDPTWNFLSYLSSHDTQLSDRNNLINEGTTFLMLPGAVQIYYGDETKRLAGPGPGDQPTRSFMNWNSIDQNVLAHWKKLGQFRQKHPAIGAGSHTKLVTTPYTFKRSLSRQDAQDDVIIVMGASGNVTINVSSIPSWTNGTVLKNGYSGQTATVSANSVTFNAGTNGVILIENPNPVILPTVAVTPENNAYNAAGHTICLSGSSMDCSAVTVYYTYDLNASETDLTSWTLFTGCFQINQNTTLKAISVNNSNTALKSQALILNYFTEIPDMTIYYKNSSGYSNVFLYHWNSLPAAAGNTSTAWPGKPMSLICNNNTATPNDDWYILTLPATMSTQLIFNCGSNACQSGNLNPPTSVSYYENGSWSTSIPATYCSDCKNVINTANSGNGSLRYAINCAVPGSTLTIDPSLNNQSILITTPLNINKNLTISTNQQVTIAGAGVTGSVFVIESDKVVTLKGLDIECSNAGNGRCITNNGVLTLEQIQLIDPVSTHTNSAVLNQNGGQIIIKNNVILEKN